jgi:hypothetical protein
MPGTPDLEGINTQLQTHTTQLDNVLVKPAGYDSFAGASVVKPYVNKAVDFRIYPVTSMSTSDPSKHLKQDSETTFSIKLSDTNAQKIRRIWLNIQAPPICTTITNARSNFGHLRTNADGVASIAIGQITTGSQSGNFTDGETVTITTGAGDGSDFSGTVTVVGGTITALTVVAGGSGYADAAGTLTGGTSTETVPITGLTVGTTLRDFPGVAGRIVMPSMHHYPENNDRAADASTAADTTTLPHCINHEHHFTAGFITHNITGNTSGNIDEFRANGLSPSNTAAMYTRLAPAALLKKATLVSGTGVIGTIDPKQVKCYNDYLASAINQISAKRCHGYVSSHDLKMASMDNCDWSVLLPFSFCHDEAGLNISAGKAQELTLELEFNGWSSILENAPAYNTDLTLTCSASTTTTAPSGAGYPAGTYAAAFGTYTVPTGRINKKLNIGMLTQNSSNEVVVPSTTLADQHFQVAVEVEYIHYFDKQKKLELANEVSERVVPVFKKIASYAFDGTAATHDEITKTFISKFPTSHLVFISQRNSAKLQHRVFDFSYTPTPTYFWMNGAQGLSDLHGAHFMDFHNQIKLELGDGQRFALTPREMKDFMPQTIVKKPIPEDAGLYMMSFSGANPYDMQQDGSVSMSAQGSHDRKLTFYPNKGGCLDHRFIGGLSSDKFTTEVWAWQQQTLRVNGKNGTIGLGYNS